MYHDTIAAISTPLGEGGIGIVRLSGKDALSIAKTIFRGKLSPRRLNYGHIIDPDQGEVVDEVLVSYMAAPHTYTREDIVEINCHGGPLPLQRTLQLVLRYGARLANPGEFTLRAFLNGRIDLAQAESGHSQRPNRGQPAAGCAGTGRTPLDSSQSYPRTGDIGFGLPHCQNRLP
jgi:tRNA modification GTPase